MNSEDEVLFTFYLILKTVIKLLIYLISKEIYHDLFTTETN